MDLQTAVFGPGWFWSALGMTLVIASLVGVSRQLRAAGAANALQRIETLQGRWDSPRMTYAKLAAAMHLRAGHVDEVGFYKAQPLLDFFVNLDDLEEGGYLSIAEIFHLWGTPIEVFVALLAPSVAVVRRRAPGTHDTSRLITKLRAYERRRRLPPERLDPESLRGWLDVTIVMSQARLREEAAWRTGTIPELPAVPELA